MPIFTGTKVSLSNHIFDGHQVILEDCTGKISGCVFENNSTGLNHRVPVKRRSIYAQIDGGAVLVTGASRLTFKKCIFRNNTSVMCGGAVSLQAAPDSRITFEDCTFTSNHADDTGPAIDILTPGQRVTVRNCTFIDNTATGKLSSMPMGQVSIFPGNRVVITRSVFHGNPVDVDIRRGRSPERLSINRLARVADVTRHKNTKWAQHAVLNAIAVALHPGCSPWK